uniref:Sorting nexin 22 n=1 Tax=Scleropages formosus TaxID=113540 RepID=A0A8C9U234_SCLFO
MTECVRSCPPQSVSIEPLCLPSLHRFHDFTLFRVEILFNGRKHFVLKRHREFVSLHKKLKKILQTPDFPNKRSPHFRQKPLEQRRQELEEYIILYENEEVPQEMLDFLQVRHFHSVNKISSSEYVPRFSLHLYLPLRRTYREALGSPSDVRLTALVSGSKRHASCNLRSCHVPSVSLSCVPITFVIDAGSHLRENNQPTPGRL